MRDHPSIKALRKLCDEDLQYFEGSATVDIAACFYHFSVKEKAVSEVLSKILLALKKNLVDDEGNLKCGDIRTYHICDIFLHLNHLNLLTQENVIAITKDKYLDLARLEKTFEKLQVDNLLNQKHINAILNYPEPNKITKVINKIYPDSRLTKADFESLMQIPPARLDTAVSMIKFNIFLRAQLSVYDQIIGLFRRLFRPHPSIKEFKRRVKESGKNKRFLTEFEVVKYLVKAYANTQLDVRWRRFYEVVLRHAIKHYSSPDMDYLKAKLYRLRADGLFDEENFNAIKRASKRCNECASPSKYAGTAGIRSALWIGGKTLTAFRIW